MGRLFFGINLKTNEDTKFLLKLTRKDNLKRVNYGIRCYDSAGVLLPLSEAAINVDGWNNTRYVKFSKNIPAAQNLNVPYTGSGGCMVTPVSLSGVLTFEVHPLVKAIDIFVYWANTASENDVTIRNINIYSETNSPQLKNRAADVSGYQIVNGSVYTAVITAGSIAYTLK